MDKKVQLLYSYITNYIKDNDISALIMLLNDYNINGSYQDYDMDKYLEDLNEFLNKEMEDK